MSVLVIVTGARTLSTVIGCHLAQGNGIIQPEFLNHPIQRHHHPNPQLSVYMTHNYPADEYHTQQVSMLVKYIQHTTKPLVIHLVSGYITIEDLCWLKSVGAVICIVVREPSKQMDSLLELPINNKIVGIDVKKLFVYYTWENLLAFVLMPGLISFVIEAEKYCSDELYRKEVFLAAKMPYQQGIVLERHRDGDLVERCCIVSKIPLPLEQKLVNAWNGKAATSRMLEEDTRIVDETKLSEWQRSYLPRAREVYELLKRIGMKDT